MGKKRGGSGSTAASSQSGETNQLLRTINELNALVRDLRAEISALKKEKKTPAMPQQAQPERPQEPKGSGWTLVKGSKGKIRDGSKDIKLREKDWAEPILQPDELREGASGVALVTQAEAEEIYAELSKCSGCMALISPQKVEEAGARSRPIQLKAETAEGRMVLLKRHITSVGDAELLPKYEKAKAIERASLQVSNKSAKIVLSVTQAHASESTYKDFVSQPRKAFFSKLAADQLDNHVLFMTQPVQKQKGNSIWIEAVATVHQRHVKDFYAASGRQEVFVKPFIDKDAEPDKTMRVCWLQEDMTLKDALSRASRFGDGTCGVVCGQRGLGIRTRSEDFEKIASKLIGKEAMEVMSKRQGQRYFEISKIPPWVDYADLQEQLNKGDLWKWETSLVRVARSWNTKTFIVRASSDPPRDHLIIDDHWLPIQAARSKPPSIMTKKTPTSSMTPPTKASTTSRATAPSTSMSPPPPSGGNEIRELTQLMRSFMRTTEERFKALEVAFSLAGSTASSVFDDEEDEDEDEEMEAEGQAEAQPAAKPKPAKRPTKGDPKNAKKMKV